VFSQGIVPGRRVDLSLIFPCPDLSIRPGDQRIVALTPNAERQRLGARGRKLQMMTGTFDPILVAASLLVAILASYTALEMAARVAASRGLAARLWLLGGSSALGIGILSMHFVGILAFRLPVALGFDLGETVLSLLFVIGSSLLALTAVSGPRPSRMCILWGALLMGAGVSGMRSMGLASMRTTPPIQYNGPLLAGSILIGVVLSGAALAIVVRSGRQSTRRHGLRAAAAVVLGLAIAGAYYAGVAAARFPAGSVSPMVHRGIAPGTLAFSTLGFASLVLTAALVLVLIDCRLESRTAILAHSLAQANEELQFLAMHDSLTKLPNRALLEDRLEQETRNTRRGRRPFSVLCLDLDGFRQINDAYGHHAGDALLVEIAQRIRAAVRSRDTVARVGGDEFVLLIDTGVPSDAASCADKLIGAIRQPITVAGHVIRISASIGIAVYTGLEAEEHDILKEANAAMYHAKEMGRNGYCFFEKSMNEDARRYLELVQDLRLAIERREFVLHYQPACDVVDGRVTGAEALLRWRHPVHGLLSPDVFIPIAEKTGLIIPIGEWVLDEACRQISEWRNAGQPHWTISVNLSAVQFNHPGLRRSVEETLGRHSLEPRFLTLEITESTAMRDADASLRILQELSTMGVRISIDDFGTGYSSLLYLKRLPASELKIDRGFVRDLAYDHGDTAIISAIIALGQSLSLNIVAEGVETVSQRDFLMRLGCRSMQGYLMGRPVPGDMFTQPLLYGKDRLPAARSAAELASC
jgi:diguanylate cyclase